MLDLTFPLYLPHNVLIIVPSSLLLRLPCRHARVPQRALAQWLHWLLLLQALHGPPPHHARGSRAACVARAWLLGRSPCPMQQVGDVGLTGCMSTMMPFSPSSSHA